MPWAGAGAAMRGGSVTRGGDRTRVAESTSRLRPPSTREPGEIRTGQLQENLSESLITVPSLAQSRQIMLRPAALGARFRRPLELGVRGVRLYSDGIPGTMPDGQGQFSQFDLGSADRIEVLRVRFGALRQFLGGVISIFTEDAHRATSSTARRNTARSTPSATRSRPRR